MTASRSSDPARSSRCFHELQHEIQSGSYELYAEVLRRTAVQIAEELEWPLEPSRAGFLPGLDPALEPVQGDATAQLAQVRQEVPDGPGLEHRRQAARPDAPPHPARLRPRRHGAAGPLLQAGPRALHRVRAPHRQQEGLGPHRLGYYHDVEPCLKAKIPVIWVNRHKEQLDPSAEEADRGGQDAARGGQAARRRSERCVVRVVGLHADVLVCTSALLADDVHDRPRACRRGRTDRRRRSSSTRRCCPRSWRRCPRCWSRSAGPARACWRRTATGTTCSAGSRSRTRRSAWPRRRRRV